jgi:hypothetical protein
MGQRARSRFPLTRAPLLGALILLATDLPVFGGDSLALRVNDAVGEPGGVVSLIVRTYAPRPIGQGQLCFRARSLAAPPSPPATPFTSLDGVTVFSVANDVVSQGTLEDAQTVILQFTSPSATVNTTDGPIAALDLRLSPSLSTGQELTVEIDLGNTFLLDEKGRQITIEPEPGRLRIRSASDEDEAGVVKFDETTFQVLESAGVAIVAVERSGGEDGAVSVDYSTSPGSATEGEDYRGMSGTLSWASEDGTPNILMVEILDDQVAEPNETIGLTLSNPQGGVGLDPERGQAVLTILDDDGGPGGGNGGEDPGEPGVVKFDQRTYLALEGAGVAVITVERSQGQAGAVSVDYGTSDGSATEGDDYGGASGTLSWASGDAGTKTFLVSIVEDQVGEANENVSLTLSNPAGGASLDDDRSTAVLTILDNDGGPGADDGGTGANPGVVKFQRTGFQVIEGNTVANVVVERSQGQNGQISVDYSTSDGSATEGKDYTGASGTASWGPGEGGAKSFTVAILEDQLGEGNETVNLALSNPTGGAQLDPQRSTALLTILDNDASTAACTANDTTHCLLDGRFKVQAVWRTADGRSGPAKTVGISDRTGLFWFFSETNIEMLIKILNACSLPDFESFWVFFAATTNVDFTLTVTDISSGIVKEYTNPLGQPALPVQDVLTFRTCP